jgi:hypothetical protein
VGQQDFKPVDYKSRFFREAEQLGVVKQENLSDFLSGLVHAIAMYAQWPGAQ